ncbi:MCE family protein [Mycobacterium sp. ACS4331]|uniref:MCE family protein n=1 Tax=Mycobacterium sp. ACS4331 TaxID=1834121 RepID=UPI0007FEE6C5|nr:MCE family protein [Mycobacterium sp. ACS4331]OBF10932.1 mammalian cell entry protein [Mycobacterium sp. ACS4331]
MKRFSERNPLVLCAVGIGIVMAIAIGALNYDKIPVFNTNKTYTGMFAEAGGLIVGAPVQVSGFEVGRVESISLDRRQVAVRFNVDRRIHVGDRSEAAIKTKSLLGSKILELTPRGDQKIDGPIPLERTQAPYQLPDALGDITAQISGLNTDQVSRSLAVLSETFKDTPPALKAAVEGVGQFSETLNRRDAELRKLLENARKATAVLSDRSTQVVSLAVDANALLAQLQTQSSALDQLSVNTSAVAQQLKGFIAENREGFAPAVEKLNEALAILDDHKRDIQVSIKKLNKYAMSLGESVSSGPFFKAYLSNLLPGQFVQPFIDAAFSDLGLDPATLLPSQLSDPQVGQPGTPALPAPYPRTGQGGEPRLTLPDAITGNPGDPRYPYRQPPPAPAPGGPPPGPPAIITPPPVSAPIDVPGPGAPQPGAQNPSEEGSGR